MCSTHNSLNRGSVRRASSRIFLSAALAAAASAALVGCGTAPRPGPEEVSTHPIPIDEAMQRRDWPLTAAEYQAGGVIAGATRFPYVPQTEGEGAGRAVLGPERSNAVLDTVYFVAQAVALPFTYSSDPPFVEKTYRGVIYEPTYTAMPVLPPEASGPRGDPYDDVPAERDVEMEIDVDAPEPATPDLGPDEVPPGETPLEAQPPIITPDDSEPAPAEPAPDVEPEPQTTEPAPVPDEPAETTEPAPEPEPEATDPAPNTDAPTDEEVDPNK